MSDVADLPWKLICPGCGRLVPAIVRVQSLLDYKCVTRDCLKRLSDYVREKSV